MFHLMNKNTVPRSMIRSEKIEPLLMTKIKLILPSAITNDNNINNVGTSKSFFRMDSTYGRRAYVKPNKVPPLSQSQTDQHKEIIPDNSSQK